MAAGRRSRGDGFAKPLYWCSVIKVISVLTHPDSDTMCQDRPAQEGTFDAISRKSSLQEMPMVCTQHRRGVLIHLRMRGRSFSLYSLLLILLSIVLYPAKSELLAYSFVIKASIKRYQINRYQGPSTGPVHYANPSRNGAHIRSFQKSIQTCIRNACKAASISRF